MWCTAAAAASYGPDARPGQSPGRLEALGGRLGRRKGSGPKKERRRTESINSAFAELRECVIKYHTMRHSHIYQEIVRVRTKTLPWQPGLPQIWLKEDRRLFLSDA